ncbi:agmatinase [Pseudomaricurvus alkylphenolicus]|jgi:agmatinase|uniref:arginase family protein n=1 Tax=Pseudomaricurvus alkylphenolicus TaxID=1306991 RepID=UPI0014203043|nr:arginase family protein [Pseudomaricurvus alkylphenolicus]NIB39891.1 agmatinase [Pseudomaricurvus alkylphenolicus]
MAKVSPQRLESYRQLDAAAFEFKNTQVQSFFARAQAQGYNLDPEAFHQHQGFFQAPHVQDPTGADIAVFGCPCDLGAIGLGGTRHGPRAVRERSRFFGPYNDATGQIPFEQCQIVDFGDVEWSSAQLNVRVEQDIYQHAKRAAEAGAYTLSCGGEHTSSYGVLKALSEVHDDSFSLIHIDAHSDTMASWGGDAVNDGSVFRQAVLQGFVDPERTVQIGIRGRSDFLWEFAHDTGMKVISADEVFEKGVAWVMDCVRERVGAEKTYFSFDVDGLDSSYMMGTTGPEPFGLTPRQVRDIILASREFDVIGADMVELNPNRDSNQMASHLATGLFFELLCLLADCRLKSVGRANPTRWLKI